MYIDKELWEMMNDLAGCVKPSPHKGFDKAKDITEQVMIEPPAYARANRECAQ